MPEFTFWDRIRSFFIFTWFLISLVLATLVLIPTLILTAWKAQNILIKYLGLFIGRSALMIAGIKLKIIYKGELPDHPVVYVFNHSSTLDLFILLALGLPRIRFVAKHEFQINPFFFILGNLTGQIFIRRSRSKESIRLLQKSQNRIKKQRLSIVMGPEGSRKHKGIIGPFKKGAFHMAVDLGYPVVPLYFERAAELCPGSSLVTKKGVVTATIQPEIDTSLWKKENIGGYTEKVRHLYLKWAGMEKDPKGLQTRTTVLKTADSTGGVE